MIYSFTTRQAQRKYSRKSKVQYGLDLYCRRTATFRVPRKRHSIFDYVVIGEGEETLPELVRTLKEGRDPES
jgi:radical SAM superfamily enzyme YgiQ (UPF0313 family)